MSYTNPIVVVTGANGGVGFGICHRFLLQLSSTHPSDGRPQENLVSQLGSALSEDAPITNVQGLTLILACRSMKKAEAARTKLYTILDEHVEKHRKLPGYDGHAESFRENLKIEIHCLDLADIHSVFRFGIELAQKYPYVSHLICNAGVGSFIGIDYWKAIWAMAKDFVLAVTTPSYFIHRMGEISVDGLGWIWQCNVFGHYCLFRNLQPLLGASKSSLGARVLWTTSIEASPSHCKSPGDWQLIHTEYSYAAAKYQSELIATHLDGLAIEAAPWGAAIPVRHILVHPGVAHTNISSELTGWLSSLIQLWTFYIARILNSPNHTIHVYKAAISAVHLSLISLSFIPSFSSSPRIGKGYAEEPQPGRFGSETDRWGTERVGFTPIAEWKEHKEGGRELLEKYDKLYRELRGSAH